MLHLPPRTVRVRLTALYGGLFLLSGVGLLVLTHILVGRVTGTANQPQPRAVHAHTGSLHQLLIESAIALAIVAVFSITLGWFVAGRVLRPLRTITMTAKQISEDNLHQRLALPGPPDELKDLADTIDGLLARLEAAFDAQRNFVANASHELRTPLTLACALIQMRLRDPNTTADAFRSTSEEVLVAGEQQERLIESLLMLARSQRGLEHHEPFDLAAVISDAADIHATAAAARGLRVDLSVSPAPTHGDPYLVERLVSNLIDNAINYNNPGGDMALQTTTTADGHARLVVSNTGPEMPTAEIERLFEPFQRLSAARTNGHDGYGVGLSIVRAIAAAHHAQLTARPRQGGGLEIQVSFPAATARTARPPGSRPNSHQSAA
jgi:signal transduction histidine kinase